MLLVLAILAVLVAIASGFFLAYPSLPSDRARDRDMARRRLAWFAALAVFAAAFAAFAYRPAVVVGTDDGVLASDLGGGSCAHAQRFDDDVWRCEIGGLLASGTAVYFVRTDTVGCWRAWRGAPAFGREPNLSGCIDLLDLGALL